MENSNLWWETISYDPIILFSLEPVMQGFRASLTHDLSHFHYFLESLFGYTNVRDLDFTSCKRFLKSELVDPGLLFYIEVKAKKIKSFDCNT